MELAGVLLGIVGALPVGALVYTSIIRGVGIRRLIGFDAGGKGAIDVVCTTGSDSKSPFGQSASLRSLVPEGEVRGIAAITTALGNWYPRKKTRIEMSARLTTQCDDDLIVIGGPAANHCARTILTWPPLAGNVVIEPNTSTLRAGSFDVTGYDHHFAKGRPTRDLAVVVCTRNQWSAGGKKRTLLFGGLTTYGTGAAAQLFFRKLRNKDVGRELRKALRGKKSVVIVYETDFSNGYLQGGRLVHWETLQ